MMNGINMDFTLPAKKKRRMKKDDLLLEGDVGVAEAVTVEDVEVTSCQGKKTVKQVYKVLHPDAMPPEGSGTGINVYPPEDVPAVSQDEHWDEEEHVPKSNKVRLRIECPEDYIIDEITATTLLETVRW